MITLEQLRAARAYLGLSQKDFAETCGLGRTSIANIEVGMPISETIATKVIAGCKKRGLLFIDGGIQPKRK